VTGATPLGARREVTGGMPCTGLVGISRRDAGRP
jgi:hypothetical protein